MKNLAKVLTMTVALSALFSFTVFADDMTANERREELNAEGLSRVEIVEILKSEGYTIKGSVRENDRSNNLSEEMKSRITELKAEGLSREEIRVILDAEGFVTNGSERENSRANNLSDEAKARIEVLKAEGLSREEIGEILKSEGLVGSDREIKDPEIQAMIDAGATKEEIQAYRAERENSRATNLSDEAKARIEVLKAEGLSREEIGVILKSEGLVGSDREIKNPEIQAMIDAGATREEIQAYRAERRSSEGETQLF